MAKVNIAKPTGSETLAVLTAFNVDGNTYIVFDSERVGSMGLPIIYVSKFNLEKLEKIIDTNEWQSVKNYLKGIINGTNFHYIKVAPELKADEAFYMPLTLPDASYQTIKNRYVVSDETTSSSEGPLVMEEPSPVEQQASIPSVAETPNIEPPASITNAPLNPTNNVAPSVPESNITPEVSNVTPTPETPIIPNVPNSSPVDTVTTNEVVTQIPTEPSIQESPQANNNTLSNTPIEAESPVPAVNDVAPVMPSENASSNTTINNIPITPEAQPPKEIVSSEISANTPQVKTENIVEKTLDLNNFINEKETFLSACANMFDALASKYQLMYEDLEKKEKELQAKELEINEKLKNANEHLANAEAREQVANIAHDNAKKVMDISSLMPKNPNTETGVI